MEVTARRGRRRKQLLDDPIRTKRGCCNLEEETLDGTAWRILLGRVCEHLVRQDYCKNGSDGKKRKKT